MPVILYTLARMENLHYLHTNLKELSGVWKKESEEFQGVEMPWQG